MIAAGVNAKALSTNMGHANISIALDRYDHLMPGSEEEEAAGLEYLTAQREDADVQARGATGERSGDKWRTWSMNRTSKRNQCDPVRIRGVRPLD